MKTNWVKVICWMAVLATMTTILTLVILELLNIKDFGIFIMLCVINGFILGGLIDPASIGVDNKNQ